MKTIKLFISITAIALFAVSCAKQSVMPDTDGMKVTREAPDKDDHCKDLGKVTGAAIVATGTREQALEDMKQSAADKGANYLVVHQYSAQGTSVTGHAYQCH